MPVVVLSILKGRLINVFRRERCRQHVGTINRFTPLANFLLDAPSSRHANQSPNVAGDLETKRREAQVFLRLLNENNIGFSCLATEDLDTNLLRALYQTLGINVPPLSTASPSDRGARQVSNKESPVTIPSTTSTPNSQAHGLPKKPMPPVKTNIAQDSSSKSAPSPVDRKEYIARLQAAKMSKQSGATKDAAAKQSPLQEQAVVPSVATPPIASITGTPTMGTSTMPTTRPAVTKSDAEKVRQTELIKQRLELLKAQGKIPSAGPSTPQPSDSVDPVPKPRQTVLASGSNVDSQPRIPGLFMNSSPAPAISSAPTDAAIDRSQDEPRPSARRRPVAADLNDDITQPQSGPTYTRPLGQSPHEHHGESLIIDVSEDESGGSEMDLDDVQNEPHISSSSAPAMQNGSHIPRKPPLATELSSRSTSVNPTRSALNTPPVPRTPAGSNAEELINKHEKAILDLKMKIAKMTEKKKAAEASKGFISSSPVPRQSGSTENRRKRRAELEAALRSLDQGLENENGRLAQLEKEITEIRTKREQYQRDRENLMKELEEYGIETEGMNDEELQAQKDEIVQNNNHPDGEQFGNNVSGQAPTADFRDASRTRTLSQQPQITSTSVQVAPTGIDAFAASSQERAVERPTPSASSTTVAPTSIPRNRNSSVLTTFGRTKDELVYLRKNNLCFNCGKEGCTAKTCKHELPVPSKDIPAFQLAGAASADVVMTDAPEMSYPATSQIGTQEQQGIHAVPPETVAAENGVESSTSVDEEDFYSPSPETAGSTAAVIQPLPGAVEEAEVVSPSEEGEVAMSESSTDDEEEYVPDEPYTAPAGAVAPPAAPTTVREEVVKVGVASNNPPSASTTEDEDEGELYEPPEPNQIQTNIQMQETSPLETRSHSMDIDDTGEMEISTLSPSSSDSEAALEQSHDRQFRGSISSNQPVQSGMAVADDLAPELQSQRPTIDGPVAEPVRLRPSTLLY